MPSGIYKRTKKHNKAISKSKKGKPVTWIKKGEDNPLWKGNNVTYTVFHKRLYRLKGKANECTEIGCTKKSKRFEWANLTGKYEDMNDYKSMCKSCHTKYDKAQFNLPHIKYGL